MIHTTTNKDCLRYHEKNWQILRNGLFSVRPTLHLSITVRSIHAPKTGASTSIRGNVLFNVTLGMVRWLQLVKSYFQLCASKQI